MQNDGSPSFWLDVFKSLLLVQWTATLKYENNQEELVQETLKKSTTYEGVSIPLERAEEIYDDEAYELPLSDVSVEDKFARRHFRRFHHKERKQHREHKHHRDHKEHKEQKHHKEQEHKEHKEHHEHKEYKDNKAFKWLVPTYLNKTYLKHAFVLDLEGLDGGSVKKSVSLNFVGFHSMDRTSKKLYLDVESNFLPKVTNGRT